MTRMSRRGGAVPMGGVIGVPVVTCRCRRPSVLGVVMSTLVREIAITVAGVLHVRGAVNRLLVRNVVCGRVVAG
jgi:hypothetical protein